MISTNEALRNPTLLEQRLLRAGEVGFFCKFTSGASPEVVEVLAGPTLHGEGDESWCRRGKERMVPYEGEPS